MKSHTRGGARSRKVPLLPVLLVLVALGVITVDAAMDDSPAEPLRGVVGDVFGPVQSGLSSAARPLNAVGEFFTTVPGLRDENAALRAANAQLKAQLDTAGIDADRLAGLEIMRAVTRDAGLDVVAASVVGVGPAQSFSRTVTIDVGTVDGVTLDMTVLNADGLVGRVVRADRSTASVLLLIDADSVVGGRLGSSMELGFLAGNGDLSDQGRLSLTTIDSSVTAAVGDAVVTWGSRNGAPYLSGVPVGSVESVQSSPRDTSTVAIVAPFVDFSSLDQVFVVVGSAPERAATQAEGGLG